jgi:hypothetical protein
MTIAETEELDIHVKGLRDMISGKGGVDSVVKLPLVGWTILWYRF